ncbi:hypothetical protein DPMN_169290 [Dreissena polymorpha]|uniref:Uncharacterized protein n=1 Tax=Dreissena polymorpha TaxID=45954 RepID=A0A9D4F2B1_DREPO|nr:hypothetical protein DPMN_169290 [Dreissena polymorpha]
MAQGGDASLLEAMKRLKRENEAFIAKCETLTLEKELDTQERDKIRSRFSTPGIETETPKPLSKLLFPGKKRHNKSEDFIEAFTFRAGSYE